MTGGHWLVASGNPGKLKELRAMLAPRGVRLSSQTELGIPDAEEPWPSFVENALAKARHGARLSGLPTLADDSGLCVPALGGAPGVRSARFALDAITDPAEREALQTGGRARLDAENIRHLLARCQDVSAPVRAYFYSVVVWVASADDPRPLIAEGLWWGTLLAQPRGEGGFGYDLPARWPRLFGSRAVGRREERHQPPSSCAGAAEHAAGRGRRLMGFFRPSLPTPASAHFHRPF